MSESATTDEPYQVAYFEATEHGVMPLELAQSSWSPTQIHGVAASGSMARAAELAVAELGRDDLRPARWRVDLFKPVKFAECRFETTVVRSGSRLLLLDVDLVQDGVKMARASATFLKITASVPGEVWGPPSSWRPTPPPLDVAPVTDEPHVPYFRSASPWSQEFGDHQNAGQHTQWTTQPSMVRGEPTTGFISVAGVSDGINLISNWGAEGVDYINADVDVSIARLPEAFQVGIHVTDRIEADGIGTATAVLFDRAGALGTVTSTFLANSMRSIDFSDVKYDDDGRRL